MSEEDMQRTLCAEFNALAASYDSETSGFVVEFGSWRALASDVFVTQQDIDLSGYALQRKTFYPYSSFEQRSGGTFAKTAATPTTQPYVIEQTIVSSVPLTDTELTISSAGNISPGFGFGYSGNMRFDREVILHGESKIYTIDNTISVSGQTDALKLIDRQIYSSLEPTAADKLYCYRIVYFSSSRSEIDSVTLPDSRVLIPGTLSEEPKLEYMMRLKRSYELANQV